MQKALSLAASVSLLLALASTCAEADDWTGIYLGIGGGVGIAKHEADVSGAIPGPPVAAAFNAGIDGLGSGGGLFTLGVGADYQVNRNVLIGAFFDYDWLDADTTSSIGLGAAGLSADVSTKFEAENQWAIGGRLGYLATQRTLLFLTAGYTQLDMSDATFDATLTGLGSASGVLASGKTFTGYFLGGGAEVRLTDAISIKGEYRYSDFGSEKVTLLPDLAPEINDIVSTTVDPTIQTGRVSLNYRFGLGHSPSVADDEPALASSETWTGVYLGIGGGLAMAKHEVDLGGAIPPPLAAAFDTSIDGIGGEGGMFTLGVGGDYQVNRSFLVGTFFDYDWLDVDSEASAAFSALGFDADASAEFKVENQWALGGRIGYLPTQRTLLFVSAGYTQVDISDTTFKATLTGLGSASGVLASVDTLSGYFLGAGAEVKLTDAISLKGEYRYTDLGSEDVTLLPNIAPEINDIVSTTIDPTIQTGRISLVYRFDWDRPAAAPLK